MNSDDLQKIITALFEALQSRLEDTDDSDSEETPQDVDTLGRRSRRNYTQRKDARNYRADYTEFEDRCICDLRRGGWSYGDIGEVVGRSNRAVEHRYLTIRRNY